MARSLDQLPQGQEAIVIDVTGDDSIALRLMEMGIIEGTVVRRVGQAPMGDPIEFAVQGSRLMLRIVEASRVQIED